MNTNVISRRDLVQMAGSNIATPRIEFAGAVFNGTKAFEHDPMASKQAYSDAIDSEYEIIQLREDLPGYTVADARIAVDVVLHRFEGGVPQPVSNDPTVTPKTMRVDIGYDWDTGEMRTRTVPAGEMSIPGFVGFPKKWQPTLQVVDHYGTPVLIANILRGNQNECNGLFKYVREYLDEHSIYLNQVVDASFHFVDLTDFKPENVALTDSLRNAIDLFVRGPLQYQPSLDREGVPSKTGVFFWGPPGGGKTMAMTTCVYLAARMGAISVIIDPSTGIDGFELAAARTARLLEAGHRVVLAMEDMEKLSTQDRAKVLDILDGSASKNSRRIVLGTTNFLERIDRAMLRPGRFDAVEFCGLPDRSATEQLIRVLLRGRNLEGVDFDVVFEAMEGYSYAFIASAVQNVVRASINRVKGDLEDDWTVTTDDLVAAAMSVRGHFDLMNEEVVVDPPKLDALFARIAQENAYEAVADYLNNNNVTTDSDNTSYSYIREQIDEVIEGRLDGAYVRKDEDGNLYIATN